MQPSARPRPRGQALGQEPAREDAGAPLKRNLLVLILKDHKAALQTDGDARTRRYFSFDQRLAEALRKAALRVAAAQVADQIVVEADAPALEEQNVRATARAVQTLRAAALDEYSGRDRLRVVISLAAVTLRDLADHQGHNLDHSH